MKIFILIQKICRDRLLSGSVSDSIFSLIFFVSARVIISPILALGMLTKHCLFLLSLPAWPAGFVHR